jgi:hypothetical protein
VGSFDLDALRAFLDMGPTEGEAWFHLPEEKVGFAPHKAGKTRALVLRRWGTGPLAVVYPRTTRDRPKEPLNPAHNHRATYNKCWLDKAARVLTRHPIPIAKDDLTEEWRLCSEEHEPTIRAVMSGPTRPALSRGQG